MESISSAMEFLKKIKDEKEINVKFIKKDGSERVMKCTLDFEKIPRDKRPKGVDLTKISSKIQKSKILSVFDLEKMDWRSIPFERVEFLQTQSDHQTYKIKLPKG